MTDQLEMEINDLPLELIMEILTRLKFKDMMNTKCVCRRWEALISDPTFLQYRRWLQSQSIRLLVCSNDFITDRHGMKIIGKPQVYISTSNHVSNNTTLNDESERTLKLTLQHKIDIEESMNVISSSFLELALLYMQYTEPAYLYNPSTEEIFTLPKNLDQNNCFLSSIGLGRIDSTNEYKVVRVLKRFGRLYCEVFTLGSDDHWRTVASPPFDISDDPGVFVAGGVYMFLEWVEREKGIARFDIKLEEWTVIPPPTGFFLYCVIPRTSLSIREVGGLFYLTDNSGQSADMWVLKDYKQGVWALENSIEFSHFSNFINEERNDPYLYPLSLDYGGDKILLVWVESGERIDHYRTKLISYDPKTHNAEELPIPHPNIDFTSSFFTESFDSLF